jgi:membrane associated rhomboid family serine protease
VLWWLGTELEPALGRVRFGIVYFASVLGGSFGALLLEPDALTAGASGAVFGLMGAAVVVMRSQGLNPLQSQLGILIALNLVLSLRPGISLGGHLGGFIAGIVAAALIVELRGRLPQVVPPLLAAALGVGAFAGAIAVSSSAG